jgi:hypothetical protein
MKGFICFIVLLCTLSFLTKSHAEESLFGNMNKSYGVREDIVAFIQSKIPRYNSEAIKAAFIIARQEQILYYEATTPEEAAKAVQKIIIANECMRQAFENKVSSYLIYKDIENLMQNNKERMNHTWAVNEKFFAKNHYQFKSYEGDELKKLCMSGEY